jgi:hypothetical protein
MKQLYSLEIGRRSYFFQSEQHLNDARERSKGFGASDTIYIQNASFVYDHGEGKFIKSRYDLLTLLKEISCPPPSQRTTPLMSELMGPSC